VSFGDGEEYGVIELLEPLFVLVLTTTRCRSASPSVPIKCLFVGNLNVTSKK
jgi:hypothetical protein